MKLRSVIIFIVGTTVLSILGRGAKPPQLPLSVAIATEHVAIKAGTEVILQITVTNTSDHEISLAKVPGNLPQAESDYSVQVQVDGNGNAQETDYGRKVREKKLWFGRSRESYTLKPGDSMKDGLILTKLYNLKQPGTYVIQLSRAVPQGLGTGRVQSNALRLKVTN